MSKVTRTIALIVCVCLAAAALAACGSSGDPSSGVVAQVGGYAITKTMLNQWITEKIGEDYYEVSTHESPPRLVSEPADYPACVASLKAITPIPGEGRPQPQPTVAQLTSRCKELYQAIKTQAIAYLVSSYWSLNFDADHGIKVTNEELQQKLKQIKAERYPTEAEFQQLLTTRRRTLAQELFIIELDLVQQKLGKKLKNESPQLTAAYIREAKSAASSASCHPGYVVEFCKGYKAPQTSAAETPSVLLEEIARWRPETSHGFTGVPVI